MGTSLAVIIIYMHIGVGGTTGTTTMTAILETLTRSSARTAVPRFSVQVSGTGSNVGYIVVWYYVHRHLYVPRTVHVQLEILYKSVSH